MDTNEKLKFNFTVLMSVYFGDNATLFEKAINSVFKNDLKPNKMLIVCDGPLSLELEKVLKLALKCYKNLELVRIEKNQGLFNALNFGLRYIDTTWTVRADADDINRSNKHQVLKELIISNPSAVLVGGAIQEVSKEGNPLGIRRPPCKHEEILIFAKKRNPFNHMTTAFRTDVVKKLGGYPNLFLREDYGLWIKILSKGLLCINTDKILVDATAGNEMYKRRGGITYAASEIDLQKFLVSHKLKNKRQAIVDGGLRAFVFLIPYFIKKYVYLFFLRNKKYL